MEERGVNRKGVVEGGMGSLYGCCLNVLGIFGCIWSKTVGTREGRDRE